MRPRPVRLGRRQSLGVAVVEHRVVERADAARRVERRRRSRRTPPPAGRAGARARASVCAFSPGKHRRHEAADRLRVDDRVADLPRLQRDEPAPDRVALRPEVLALVVEALRVAVDHDAERHAIHARADAAVVQRRARVDRHAMALRRVADRCPRPGRSARAARRPCCSGCRGCAKLSAGHSPRSLRPHASRSHSRFDSKPPLATTQARAAMRSCPDARRDEAVAVDLERVHRRVVADLHAQRRGAAVVRVDERLAAAHEERVRAAQVQRARQRRLEAHAVPVHPRAARAPTSRMTRRASRSSVAPARDLEQVLPELLLRVGVGQHVLAAHRACSAGCACAPSCRRATRAARIRAAAPTRRPRAPSARRTARRCRRRSRARRSCAPQADAGPPAAPEACGDDRRQTMPPLGGTTWPCTHDARGETTNATTPATSSGVPMRLNGLGAAERCFASSVLPTWQSSVSSGPGATASTRTVRGATAVARCHAENQLRSIRGNHHASSDARASRLGGGASQRNHDTAHRMRPHPPYGRC